MSEAGQITVRLALVSDIPAIMTLQRQAESAAQWTASEYERMLAQNSKVVLIAAKEGDVLGFLAGSGVGAEWELENIVTKQDMRRRGTGWLLVQSFLDHARGGGGESVFLQVRQDNAAARSLYERAGFSANGRRPGYYGSSDAVLYVFDLT